MRANPPVVPATPGLRKLGVLIGPTTNSGGVLLKPKNSILIRCIATLVAALFVVLTVRADDDNDRSGVPPTITSQPRGVTVAGWWTSPRAPAATRSAAPPPRCEH